MSSRPLTVTTAAVLLVLVSVWQLRVYLKTFGQYPHDVVAIFLVLLPVASLLAAAGLWRLKRWSMWPSVVVCVLNMPIAMLIAIVYIGWGACFGVMILGGRWGSNLWLG